MKSMKKTLSICYTFMPEFPNLSSFEGPVGEGERGWFCATAGRRRARTAPFARATCTCACHSHKWSTRACACLLLAEVEMHMHAHAFACPFRSPEVQDLYYIVISFVVQALGENPGFLESCSHLCADNIKLSEPIAIIYLRYGLI